MTTERITHRTKLRSKGQLTLPPEIREALRVKEGDDIEFAIEEDGTVTVRGYILIPADQAWFFTPEWQAKEREADDEIARGDVTYFDSHEDFMAALEQRDQDLRAEGR